MCRHDRRGRRTGADAVNATSHLLIEAYENVKATANASPYGSPPEPDDFWRKAVATFRTTRGALYCDETVIASQEACGYRPEDARNYGIIGCVEPPATATRSLHSGNDVSLVAALEMRSSTAACARWAADRPPHRRPAHVRALRRGDAAYKRQLTFLVRMIAAR